MTTNAPAQIAPTTQIVSTETKRPDFGHGRYSALANEVYDAAQAVFRCNETVAEKLARQVASDIGAVMASAPVGVRLGNMNKNGNLTISEACKVKNVTVTHAIFCLRALRYAGEAGQYGFGFSSTKWTMTKLLADELANFE